MDSYKVQVKGLQLRYALQFFGLTVIYAGSWFKLQSLHSWRPQLCLLIGFVLALTVNLAWFCMRLSTIKHRAEALNPTRHK